MALFKIFENLRIFVFHSMSNSIIHWEQKPSHEGKSVRNLHWEFHSNIPLPLAFEISITSSWDGLLISSNNSPNHPYFSNQIFPTISSNFINDITPVQQAPICFLSLNYHWIIIITFKHSLLIRNTKS